MRILKLVGQWLIALIGLVLVAGLFMPKQPKSVYSVVINAPKEVVWEQLRSLRGHNNWSPWFAHDPNMKVTYTGEDGNIGSKSNWIGDIVGVGEQTLSAVEVMKTIKVDLQFIKPMKNTADATLTMTDHTEKGIKVDWTFGMNMPYPFNTFAPLMGDGGVGDDFRNGLQKLKKICESQAENTQNYGFNIVEEQVPSTTYIGIRGKTPIQNAVPFYQKNIVKVAATLTDKGLMTGAPAGLYFDWDAKTNMTDMAAVMPVQSSVGVLDKAFSSFSLPAAKYAVIDFMGPYNAKMSDAHTALGNYLAAHKIPQKAPIVEIYKVAPANTPDSTKWHTRIMYPM